MKWFPNFLTICNLLCGCVAVLMALQGAYITVFWLVIASAVFDFCDGFAARLFRAYSPMGKELDSLADMVSFGLVPAVVVYSLMQSGGAGYWSYGAFFIAAMSALRLAKFNIDERQTENFIGMPTPACALFFVSYATFAAAQPLYVHAVAAVVLGLLLVSPIPMFSFKFKSVDFKNNAVRYVFALFAVVMIALFGYAGPAMIIMAYALISSVLTFVPAKK